MTNQRNTTQALESVEDNSAMDLSSAARTLGLRNTTARLKKEDVALAARELGRAGGKVGGLARAKVLTATRRKEIAVKASQAAARIRRKRKKLLEEYRERLEAAGLL